MKKLLSRKFLVTLGALVALLEGSNLDSWKLFVIAGVAVAYVVSEAVLDHAALPPIVSTIESAVGELIESAVAKGPTTNVTNVFQDSVEKGFDLLSKDLEARAAEEAKAIVLPQSLVDPGGTKAGGT